MTFAGLAMGLALIAQAVGAPDEGPGAGPVWSWGLTNNFVPATSSPPATRHPTAPVETWYWQFFAEESDGYDTLASHVVLDCQLHVYRMTRHLAYRDGHPTGAGETDTSEPMPIASGSVMDGLRQHLCEPDPAREVRRYSSVLSARHVFDEHFAMQRSDTD